MPSRSRALDPRGIAVDAEDLAEHVGNFADSAVPLYCVKDGRHEVTAVVSRLLHARERYLHCCRMTRQLALTHALRLLALDRIADPQEFQRRRFVHVILIDADHDL